MLKLRLITASLILLTIFTVVVFLPPVYTIGLIALVSLVAFWEWMGLFKFRFNAKILASLGALALIWYTGFSGLWKFSSEITTIISCSTPPFWLLAAYLVLKYKGQWKSPNSMVGLIWGLVVLIPFWLCSLALFKSNQLSLVLILLAIVSLADSFAYLGGRAFGKTLLSPHVSPKKNLGRSYDWMACSDGFC
jgi:phosphatidate cytidylyltransferase